MLANDAKRICWRDQHVSYEMHVPTMSVSTAHTAFSDGRQITAIAAPRTELPYLWWASNSFSKPSFCSLCDSCRVFLGKTLITVITFVRWQPLRFPAHTKNCPVSAHCSPETLQHTGSSEVLFVSMILQCHYAWGG